MDLKIEEIRETKKGIEVYGSIHLPRRDDVSPLGDLNSDSEPVRAARLKRWTENSKEANKKYTKELCAYRRVHLGLATFKQEDIEE